MAVGKFGAGSAFGFVDGYNLISQKITGLREKHISPTEDVTGLGDANTTVDPTGVLSTEVVQEGAYFDTTATTGGHVAFSGKLPTTPQTAARIMCVGFAGNTTGYPFVGYEGTFSNEYEVLAESGALTKANATFTMTGKRSGNGKILQPLAAKTADWNTVSTSVDNAASSASGGEGFIQCTAASGFSDFEGRIMHSADDSSYVALITFTRNVTDPYAERKTVSGTVNRYLAFYGSTWGSGSITIFAGFSRA